MLHLKCHFVFIFVILAAGLVTLHAYGLLQAFADEVHTPSKTEEIAYLNKLLLATGSVPDSETGKDVYRLFAIRFGLFVGVTLYAWFAFGALEWLRARHRGATPAVAPAT